ncbi:hypothetical protein [Porphyromonas pogonae]|uniref:hypothetical protein n=1 Tax=Porphyromonas pogonae TaxID=867595 RepID=UPI002E78BB7D|nr:hypothetical protein [Porphyromonas pogonae]
MTKRESRKQRSNWPAMQRSHSCLFSQQRLLPAHIKEHKRMGLRLMREVVPY